jgi:hypothetical protein
MLSFTPISCLCFAVRCADDLHPLRVLSLFRNIPDEDLDVLDIAGESVD